MRHRSTYRSARRNEAKKLKLLWRKLPRLNSSGTKPRRREQVFVYLTRP